MFVCGEMRNIKELKKAATLGLDRKKFKSVFSDKNQLPLLAGSNVIVLDVNHRSCLVELYRKPESVGCDMTENNEARVIRDALNEIVNFTATQGHH